MTQPSQGAESAPSAYDTCYCGDYRKDHVDGIGRCRMPDDLTHGFQQCREFRLLERARPATKWEYRP